ncbi:MAG: C45 family autoproteolytic acyltransferase/hydrolase [Bacillota bacterium]|uniref:C45 family autoproteolytic acyltransferase/hydolase n=1 Tax=Rossellomorea sp. FM04394 TaxID=3243076 RepID=UPI0035A63B2B
MPSFNVSIVQARGDSFQIGLKTGENVCNTSILKIFESVTKQEIDLYSMKSIYSTFAPHLLEELEGLAQGLGISPDRAAALFSGYDVPKTEAMGCSTLLTNEYYVRNYDFSPALYDGIFSLIQADETFATAGYNLQGLGRHDGVNEKGLVAGLHFVSHDGYAKGVSPWTAIRMVLDRCSYVDEAVAMLKEIPHSACYNFSLGDQKGNMAEVEASSEKVIVRYGDSALSCVNHFQDDRLKSKNRDSIEGSVQRNEHLLRLVDKSLTHHDMFRHFKSVESPIFFTAYESLFGTLHTFSYSYQHSRILTTIARSSQILDINLKDWVKGQDIREESLSGFIVEG